MLRAFPELRTEDALPSSGVLDERHATDGVRRLLPACFACLLRDNTGRPWLAMERGERPAGVCFLEKTPRNALNIAFLRAVFPRARFIYLQRDVRANVASLIEAWRLGLETGRFVTFRHLPGWDRPGWCFLLPRGWQSCIGRSLAEIAAFQWQASNDAIIDALEGLPASQHVTLTYDELVKERKMTIARLCRFAEIAEQEPGEARLSRTTLTPPSPEKWRKHESAINALLPTLEKTAARMKMFAEKNP